MATAREVKNRIRSVKNISQITRALEAVSASRVRRAQERAAASRAYAEKAWEILLNIQNATQGAILHPLLTEREEVKSAMVVLITSDRGLAGAYNTNVQRVATQFEQRFGKNVQYIAVGRKGRDSLIRLGKSVVAEFSDMPANPTVSDVSPIAQIAVDAFLSGEVDEVLIAYTDFINMLTQAPVVLGWLPLTPYTTAQQVAAEYVKDVPQVTGGVSDYEYEPNAALVVEEIVPRFTELQLYQALLESQASEHAARMNAMRNATDNASQLVDDLTLEYNKARQAGITSEILDIVGGANALEASLKSKNDAPLDFPVRTNGDHEIAPPKAASAPMVTNFAPPEPEPEYTTPDVKEKSPASTKPDDLTKIEGIGPKMSAALIAEGYETFEKIAAASEEGLRTAIENQGLRFAPSLLTWADQAKFAARGDWDGLKMLQDSLTAGRKSDEE
jgi:F-type H+-transporting ATPase subunit gamma